MAALAAEVVFCHESEPQGLKPRHGSIFSGTAKSRALSDRAYEKNKIPTLERCDNRAKGGCVMSRAFERWETQTLTDEFSAHHTGREGHDAAVSVLGPGGRFREWPL